jgi:hypothetical protein
VHEYLPHSFPRMLLITAARLTHHPPGCQTASWCPVTAASMQALRDVDSVHSAWVHTVSPERLQQARFSQVAGNTRHAAMHMFLHMLFLALLAMVAWLSCAYLQRVEL